MKLGAKNFSLFLTRIRTGYPLVKVKIVAVWPTLSCQSADRSSRDNLGGLRDEFLEKTCRT